MQEHEKDFVTLDVLVVEHHAIIRANVMNALIFAKVAVMEVVMVRVSHQLKAKIL